MPRTFKGWQGKPNFRWVKMHKGKFYRVSCADLGLPESKWTKEDSYHLAVAWWDSILAEITPANIKNENRLRALEILIGKKIETQEQADAALNHFRQITTFAELPDGFAKAWLGEERHAEIEKGVAVLVKPPSVPVDRTISSTLDAFLALKKSSIAYRTYYTLADNLEVVRVKWGTLDVSCLDESRVAEHHQSLSESKVEDQTKKKRWGQFQQYIRFLVESGKIEQPRNLLSKLFRFTAEAKAVKTWPIEVVRQSLMGLPDKLRLWALLVLNCSMNNTDTGALTKNQVGAGYLTRRRSKTARLASTPTVSYKLWPETVALLEKFKSNHATLWLTTENGTPLVTDTNGLKDMISKHFTKYKGDCPLLLKNFRSIGATLLHSHPTHRGQVELYLGHSVKSITQRHYAGEDQGLFDHATDWLRSQIFG